jgi:hypothetical protein
MIIPPLLLLIRAQMPPYHFPDGSRSTYTGTVLRDSNQEHGPGLRQFDDNECQEGEFCDGNLNGYGRCECEWPSASQV